LIIDPADGTTLAAGMVGDRRAALHPEATSAAGTDQAGQRSSTRISSTEISAAQMSGTQTSTAQMPAITQEESA
jgi:hypothetical protein